MDRNICWFIRDGVPFLFITFFHIRKVMKMGHSVISGTDSATKIKMSMSMMLIIISIVYLLSSLYPLFFFIVSYFICVKTKYRSEFCSGFFYHDEYEWFVYLSPFCLLLNNCINPLIYFMFSPLMCRMYSSVRRLITRLFWALSER